MTGLEISVERSVELVEHSVEQPDSAEQIMQALRKHEDSLPPDLRAENINSYDAILNWSGSPEANDGEEMPMTGDQPL